MTSPVAEFDYYCVLCRQLFETSTELESHANSCHAGDVYDASLFSDASKAGTSKEGKNAHLFSAMCEGSNDQGGKETKDAIVLERTSDAKNMQNCFVCNVCCQIFSSNEQLQEHVVSHNRQQGSPLKPSPKPYVCSICGKSFKRPYELQRHVGTHTGERPYKCETCGHGFMDSAALNTHIRTHTGVKPFACEICGKAFSRRHDVKRHAVVHIQPKNRRKCQYCRVIFDELSKLRAHVNAEHVEKGSFPCVMCSEIFSSMPEIHKHLKIHLDSESISTSPPESDGEGKDQVDASSEFHKCPVCDKAYLRRTDLKQHLKTHTQERDFMCGICATGCRDASALRVHMRTHTRDRPYKCPLCDKRFNRNFDVGRHLSVHQKQKELECPLCDHKFTDISIILRHLEESHNVGKTKMETRVSCTECGMKMFSEMELQLHMTLHKELLPEKMLVCNEIGGHHSTFEEVTHDREDDDVDETSLHEDGIKPSQGDDVQRNLSIMDDFDKFFSGKNYYCRICEFRFGRSQDLKRHMEKLHPGETPYKCNICQVNFAERDQLKIHIITHSTPLSKCDICQASFRTEQKLESHMKFHAGENPFICSICYVAFVSPEELETHISTHDNNGKPFQCELCEHSFLTYPSLSAHIRTHTGEKLFSCQVCDKSFGRKYDLTRHSKIHIPLGYD